MSDKTNKNNPPKVWEELTNWTGDESFFKCEWDMPDYADLEAQEVLRVQDETLYTLADTGKIPLNRAERMALMYGSSPDRIARFVNDRMQVRGFDLEGRPLDEAEFTAHVKCKVIKNYVTLPGILIEGSRLDAVPEESLPALFQKIRGYKLKGTLSHEEINWSIYRANRLVAFNVSPGIVRLCQETTEAKRKTERIHEQAKALTVAFGRIGFILEHRTTEAIEKIGDVFKEYNDRQKAEKKKRKLKKSGHDLVSRLTRKAYPRMDFKKGKK